MLWGWQGLPAKHPRRTPRLLILNLLARALAPLRVVAFVVWLFTAGLLPGMFRTLLFWNRVQGSKSAAFWTSVWGRGGAWILGTSIRVVGPPPPPGSFVASNHVSWQDILVLGAASPAVFIAKAEISRWPLFGWVARRGNTLFINRESMRDAARMTEELRWYMENGIPVNIFAEGGAGSGETVRKFRAPLFQTPASLQVPCVPAVICYSSRELWWPEDRRLLAHVLHVAGLRKSRVEVRFGEPVQGIEDRKELAAELQSRCEKLYDATL